MSAFNVALETRFGRTTNIFAGVTKGKCRSLINLNQYRYAVVGNGDNKTHFQHVKNGSGKGANVVTLDIHR